MAYGVSRISNAYLMAYGVSRSVFNRTKTPLFLTNLYPIHHQYEHYQRPTIYIIHSQIVYTCGAKYFVPLRGFPTGRSEHPKDVKKLNKR